MRSFTNPEHRTHLDLSTLNTRAERIEPVDVLQERIEVEGGCAGAVYSSPTSCLGKRAVYCRVISPCLRSLLFTLFLFLLLLSFQSKDAIVPNKPYPYRPLSQKEGPPISRWAKCQFAGKSKEPIRSENERSQSEARS